MRNLPAVIVCIAAFDLGGCAKYEYIVTEPAEFAGRLTHQERSFEREPVIYHLVDASDRVGIRIENPSDESLTMRGEDSFLIGPDGQSHALRGGTIAPHSWVNVTVPPLHRTYDRPGGIGFGLGVGGVSHGVGTAVGIGYDAMDFGVPRDVVDWRWKDGECRIRFTLQPKGDADSRVEHEFAIVKRKLEN
jgi:hypothetical protein